MKGQSYTFTAPMGRTACTEPQCLYNGALYLYFYGPVVQYAPSAETIRTPPSCHREFTYFTLNTEYFHEYY
jgi:hypothetical protein